MQDLGWAMANGIDIFGLRAEISDILARDGIVMKPDGQIAVEPVSVDSSNRRISMAKKPDEIKRSSNEDVVVTGRPLVEGTQFDSDTDHAIDSIQTVWNGGERVLAGARASELVYGSGKKPNQKTLDELMERVPGIEKYISAPNSGVVVDTIPDESGVPNSRLPEANQTQAGQNLSSETAKEEQDSVDKVLEPGRKAREEANDDGKTVLGSTELNPSDDASNKPNDPDRPNRNPNKR